MSDHDQPRKITLKDVARSAGVGLSTASRALRDHPACSASTKERIQKIARKLGYVPDPTLSRLVSYRKNVRGAAFKSVIGVLTPKEAPLDFSSAAVEYARRLGYQVETIPVADDKKSQERLSKTLIHRGINGIIIHQFKYMKDLYLDWDHFACIAIGGNPSRSLYHSLSANYLGAINLVFKHLPGIYKRPGLIATKSIVENETGRSCIATYKFAEDKYPAIRNIPVYYTTEKWDRAAFQNWIVDHQIDVVISNFGEAIQDAALGAGFSVPDELGLVSTTLAQRDSDVSGAYLDRALLHRTSIKQLHQMLAANIIGRPEQPMSIQIQPKWNQGKTLVFE